MFITSHLEIIEAHPSAKIDAKGAAKLIRYIEEEEDHMIEPLLGYDLMLCLSELYRAMMEFYGAITNPVLSLGGLETADLQDIALSEETTLTESEQKRVIPLLRDIQSALVYRMFANKIFSLSTSLNLGGGANRASSGDYEPADDKHLQELRKEFYMNSRRSCDNILLRLERDAKSHEPLWLDLWKDAESYYMKEDLLLPTMRVLTKYFPCNDPTKFIDICPSIRYCQDRYIAPRVGDDLLANLLDPSHKCSDRELEIQKKLRVALAYYVRAKEGPREERNEALMTADGAMSVALAYIEKNPGTSPDPSQGGENDQPSNTQHPTSNTKCCCEKKEPEYTTFSSLWLPGVNRH